MKATANDRNLKQIMDEITSNYRHKLLDMEDAASYAYIKGSIQLLENQGKDITKYAMVRVSTPMEYKDDGMRISSQLRIVPVEDLKNLPVYED